MRQQEAAARAVYQYWAEQVTRALQPRALGVMTAEKAARERTRSISMQETLQKIAEEEGKAAAHKREMAAARAAREVRLPLKLGCSHPAVSCESSISASC